MSSSAGTSSTVTSVPRGHHPDATKFGVEQWKSRALYEQSRRERFERELADLAFRAAADRPKHVKGWRRFWSVRVGFILLNAPAILWMQVQRPSLLVPYLVWMSWAAWLSSELPNPGAH